MTSEFLLALAYLLVLLRCLLPEHRAQNQGCLRANAYQYRMAVMANTGIARKQFAKEWNLCIYIP